MRGLFISFEGIDGAGKSTQIQRLTRYLDDIKLDYLVVREPGATSIGEAIRKMLLNPDYSMVTKESEALLYAAARAQLVQEVIRTALAQGEIVLCDRFVDSTIAYQGFGRGLSLEFLHQLNMFATNGLQPDLTLLYNVSPDIGLMRSGKATKQLDRIEQEDKAFYQRVYQGYLRIARESPARVKVIDADGDIDWVFQRTLAAVTPYLEQLKSG